MTEAVAIYLPGQPVPWARARIRAEQGHSFYTPAKRRKYRDAIRWEAKIAMGGRLRFLGPVSLTVIATLEPLKTIKRDHPTERPDLDNYVKLAMDALNFVVINDDAQVVELKASKRYGKPALFIEVREIDGSADTQLEQVANAAEGSQRAPVDQALSRHSERRRVGAFKRRRKGALLHPTTARQRNDGSAA